MNVALLNVRIMIQKNTVTTDTIGNRTSTWQNYYSCAATGSNERSGEAEAAGTTVDDTEMDFTIRYSSETACITPTGYRVIFASGIWDITAVDHMKFKRKSIKLKCRKARR